MTQWIIIGLLYVLLLLSFRVLGGFGAAAGAFRNWGSASGGIKPDVASSN
jgi:hypothetical protein